jgi:hypothetical protein
LTRIGLLTLLLIAAQGCMTANVLDRRYTKPGQLGPAQAVYVGDAGSVTVLAELDDARHRRVVGLHASDDHVRQAVQRRAASPASVPTPVTLYVSGVRRSPGGVIVFEGDGPAADLTRGQVAARVGPGQWVDLPDPPSDGGWQPVRVDVWIDGRQVPLRINAKAGRFVYENVGTVLHRTAMLPLAVVADTAIVVALVPVATYFALNGGGGGWWGSSVGM